MRLLLLLTLLLLPRQSDVENELAGTQAKEWIFKRWEASLGKIATCSAGEIWTFKRDKTLDIKECVGGRPKITKKRWTLKRENDLDITITIDGTVYTLVFPPTRNRDTEEMFLRSFANNKVEPTVDRQFIRRKTQ